MRDTGLTKAELDAAVGVEVSKIGMGTAMKNKWIAKDGDRLVPVVPDAGAVKDSVAELLVAVQQGQPVTAEMDAELKLLKKRKLVNQVTRKSLQVKKGNAFKPRRVKKMAELTKAMLGNKAEVSFTSIPYICRMMLHSFHSKA